MGTFYPCAICSRPAPWRQRVPDGTEPPGILYPLVQIGKESGPVKKAYIAAAQLAAGDFILHPT